MIVSLLFTYMFSGQGGLVNYFLMNVLHVINKNIMWLADPVLALVPVVLVDIWKGVGWTVVIFLAGLAIHPGGTCRSCSSGRCKPLAAFGKYHSAQYARNPGLFTGGAGAGWLECLCTLPVDHAR